MLVNNKTNFEEAAGLGRRDYNFCNQKKVKESHQGKNEKIDGINP